MNVEGLYRADHTVCIYHTRYRELYNLQYVLPPCLHLSLFGISACVQGIEPITVNYT